MLQKISRLLFGILPENTGLEGRKLGIIDTEIFVGFKSKNHSQTVKRFRKIAYIRYGLSVLTLSVLDE